MVPVAKHSKQTFLHCYIKNFDKNNNICPYNDNKIIEYFQ